MKRLFTFFILIPVWCVAIPLNDNYLETGIGVIQCPSEKGGFTYELLDAYEGKALYDHHEPEFQKNLNFVDSVALAAQKWTRTSADMGTHFEYYVHEFNSVARTVQNAQIVVTFDPNAMVLPTGCVSKTVLFARVDQWRDEIFYNEKIWQVLSDYQKAQALHGLFLQRGGARGNLSESDLFAIPFRVVGLRSFNSFFWTESFEQLNLKQIIPLLRSMSFSHFAFRGLAVIIKYDITTEFYTDKIFKKVRNDLNVNFSNLDLGSDLENQESRFKIQSGEVSFLPDGSFKCYSISERNPIPIKVLNHEVFVFGESERSEVCVYPENKFSSGMIARRAKDEPWFYKDSLIEISFYPSYQPPGTEDNADFYLELWPNQKIKYSTGVGKIFIQNNWFRFEGSVRLSETGVPEAAFIAPGQIIVKKDGSSYKVVHHAQNMFFDENGLVTQIK